MCIRDSLLTPSKTSFRLSQKVVLSSTFPSDGPYVTTTHTLTFSNLNLTIRILGHTHKVYHSSIPQVTHQNCNFFSPPLIPFHTSTHTFHTTPHIFTVSFHLCFSHSEQIKFAFSKYIHHHSSL